VRNNKIGGNQRWKWGIKLAVKGGDNWKNYIKKSWSYLLLTVRKRGKNMYRRRERLSKVQSYNRKMDPDTGHK